MIFFLNSENMLKFIIVLVVAAGTFQEIHSVSKIEHWLHEGFNMVKSFLNLRTETTKPK